MNTSRPVWIRITIELAIIALTVAILTVAFRQVSAGQWTQLYWIVTTAAPCALIFYACARPVSLAPVLRRVPGEIKYGWLLPDGAAEFAASHRDLAGQTIDHLRDIATPPAGVDWMSVLQVMYHRNKEDGI